MQLWLQLWYASSSPPRAPRAWNGRGGHGLMEMESPVSLMDVDEEIKMLEEYRDALNAHLAKVNKRLEGLKR